MTDYENLLLKIKQDIFKVVEMWEAYECGYDPVYDLSTFDVRTKNILKNNLFSVLNSALDKERAAIPAKVETFFDNYSEHGYVEPRDIHKLIEDLQGDAEDASK